MYCYLYDEKLGAAGYQRSLASIETRLHDLDIDGTICRLTPTKNLRAIVDQELKNRVNTIVAVGDDILVERLVNILASLQTRVVLGIIPMMGSGNHTIAQSLFIPVGLDACNILSYRMIRTLRLGKINNRYFLTTIECSGRLEVDCGGLYRITSASSPLLSIRITNNAYEALARQNSHPPSLQLTLNPQSYRSLWLGSPRPSVFFNHQFSLHSGDRLVVTIDNHRMTASPPIVIESSTAQVRIITGSLRPSMRSASALKTHVRESSDDRPSPWQ